MKTTGVSVCKIAQNAQKMFVAGGWFLLLKAAGVRIDVRASMSHPPLSIDYINANHPCLTIILRYLCCVVVSFYLLRKVLFASPRSHPIPSHPMQSHSYHRSATSISDSVYCF